MKELTKAFNLEFTDTNKNQGWAYGKPVGITTNQWPRSRVNGLPMAHIFTVLVPEDYHVKGADYVAISLFQADDHVADNVEGVEDVIDNKTAKTSADKPSFWKSLFSGKNEANADAFWTSLLNYANTIHPMEIYMEDIIGGGWALIWLTEKEFNADATELPNKTECTFPDYETFDGTSCFAQNEDPKYIKFAERENDPNIGRPLEDFPDENDEKAYISMFSTKGEELKLNERFFGKNHFGGTANPVQAVPDFSPFYIEFEENFGNANMGGGNGQIDLLNDELDWACG